MALLELKNMNITYKVGKKRVFAVQDACMEIEEQDAVGIVGESGSGKSTLSCACSPPELRILMAKFSIMVRIS